MYQAIDERIDCDRHGPRVRGALHLYVKDGDPDNVKHGWLVCLACARRMDRDPAFKASKRAAFEEYQRHLDESLAEAQKKASRAEQN